MFGGLTIQAVFLVVIGAARSGDRNQRLRRSIRMKKQKAQRTEDSSDQSCGKAG